MLQRYLLRPSHSYSFVHRSFVSSSVYSLCTFRSMSSSVSSSPPSLSWIESTWKSMDAICFDVDSTVSTDEGIDVLAASLGKGDEVKAFTQLAMNGNTPFEVALESRLNIMKPSLASIEKCLVEHPPKLTDGMLELIQALQSKHIHVFLVSGGFTHMIEPLRQTLHIPKENLIANILLFHTKQSAEEANNNQTSSSDCSAVKEGDYLGYDKAAPTSRSGGKAKAIESILSTHSNIKNVVMVGDGMTDAEASPPAVMFVGYGGVVAREAVKQKAHHYVYDFKTLTQWTKEIQKKSS